MNKFPNEGEFTPEELTAWLDTLGIDYTIGIIEKLWKDMRDYALAMKDVLERS